MSDKELIYRYVDKSKHKKAFKKLEKGISPQYIVGNTEFYDNIFIVNKNVLIPRFETEYLVDILIKKINDNFKEKVSIADLGTGSGVIAITLAKNTNSNVTAFDISNKALKVAKKNDLLLNSNVTFKKHDINKKIPGKYDILVSNPPYISKDEEVEERVLKNEPHLALFAPNDGLSFYDNILSYSKEVLNKKNIIAFEIGMTQADYIKEKALEIFPKAKVEIIKDLPGKDRYIFIINE